MPDLANLSDIYVTQGVGIDPDCKPGCYHNGSYYTFNEGGYYGSLIPTSLLCIPDFETSNVIELGYPEGLVNYTWPPRLIGIDNYIVCATTLEGEIKIVYYNLTTESWSEVISTGKYSRLFTDIPESEYARISTKVTATINNGKVLFGYTDYDDGKFWLISYYPDTELEYIDTGIEGYAAKYCYDMGYFKGDLYLFSLNQTDRELYGPHYVITATITNVTTGETIDLEEPDEGIATEKYTMQRATGYAELPFVLICDDVIRFMYKYSIGAFLPFDDCSKLIYGCYDGETYTCKTLLKWGYQYEAYPSFLGTQAGGGLMPYFESNRYMISFYCFTMDADDKEDYGGVVSFDRLRNRPGLFKYDFMDDHLYYTRLKSQGGVISNILGSNIVTTNESEGRVSVIYRGRDYDPWFFWDPREYTQHAVSFHLDTTRVNYHGSLRRTIPYVKYNGEMKRVNAMLYKYGNVWRFLK